MAFPDVVLLLRDYLQPILDPVPVSSRVPKPRPTQFVQIRREGGHTETIRDVARIDIITWAPTDPEAMRIALDARAAIWALAGRDHLGVMCYRVEEFLAPRQDDDEKTGTPRVWFTPELHLRADEVIHLAP